MKKLELSVLLLSVLFGVCTTQERNKGQPENTIIPEHANGSNTAVEFTDSEKERLIEALPLGLESLEN